MKKNIKTVLLSMAVTATLVLTGCSNSKNASQANKPQLPTATQIVNKLDSKSMTSAAMRVNCKISSDGDVITNAKSENKFRQDPLLVQMTVNAEAEDETVTTREWLDENNLYIQSNNDWFKAPLDKISSGAALKEQLKKSRSQNVKPNKDITKSMKVKKENGNYILTLDANKKDKATLKKYVKSILGSTSQVKQQKQFYDAFLEECKFKKVYMKEVVDAKTYKIKGFDFKFVMKAENMTIDLAESADQIGKFDNLTLPSEVKNAKNLTQAQLDTINKSADTTSEE